MPDEAVTPEAPPWVPKDWSHVLAEFTGMEELQAPIRASARIKYTSLAVSKQYIALGSTTGAVYIFQKSGLKYLQLLSSETEGSVIQVEFSPDDEICAYTTSKGYAVVMDLNISKRGKPERLRLSVDHKNATITSLCWDELGNRLYIADNTGKVTAANISTSKAKDLIKLPSEVILRLDSAVVQMDYLDGKLLISTLTKSYLCNTVKQTFTQIGKKARDGRYGSCFFHGPKIQNPSIYCSRPGSRMWEVDAEGNVLNTHQFKQLLAIPPMPVISYRCSEEIPDIPVSGQGNPLSTNLPVLLLSSEQFLLSWSEKGIYVFDPANVKVVLWTNQYQDIISLRCHNSDVYFLHGSNKVTKLSILPVEKCVLKLFVKQQWKKCAQLCVRFSDIITSSRSRRHVAEATLNDLREHLLSQNMEELANKMEELVIKLEPEIHDKSGSSVSSRRSSGSSMDGMKLESGIYLVNSKPKKKAISDNDRKSSAVVMPSDTDASTKLPSANGKAHDITDATEGQPDTKSSNGKDSDDSLANENSQNTNSIDFQHGKGIETITHSNGGLRIIMEGVNKDDRSLLSASESSMMQRPSSGESMPESTSVTISVTESKADPEFQVGLMKRSTSGSSLHSIDSADVVLLKRKLSSESLMSLELKSSHSSPGSRRGSITSSSSTDMKQSSTDMKHSIRESDEIVVRTRKSSRLKKKRGSSPVLTSSHPEKLVGRSTSYAQLKDSSPRQESCLERSMEQGSEFLGSFESSQEFDPTAAAPASNSPKTTFLAMKERFSTNFSTKKKSIFKTFKDLKDKAKLPMRNFPSNETGLLDIKHPSLQPYTEESAIVEGEREEEEDERETKPKSEFPIIDTSILQKETELARQKLHNSEVLSNPGTTQEVLLQWVKHLLSALQLLHTSIHNLKEQEMLQVQQWEMEKNKQAKSLHSGSCEQSEDKGMSSPNEVTLMETSPEMLEKDAESKSEKMDYDVNRGKLLLEHVVKSTETTKSNGKRENDAHVTFGEKELLGKQNNQPGCRTHEQVLDHLADRDIIEKSNQDRMGCLGQSKDDDEGIVLTLTATGSEENSTSTFYENPEVSEGDESDHYDISDHDHRKSVKIINEMEDSKLIKEGSSVESGTLSELSSECENLTISPGKSPDIGSIKSGDSHEFEKPLSQNGDRLLDPTTNGATLTDDAIKDTLSHLFDNPIYIRDPFSLEKDLHEQVADLAMLCFEARIHGDISSCIHSDIGYKNSVTLAYPLGKGAPLSNASVECEAKDDELSKRTGERTLESNYILFGDNCKVVEQKHQNVAAFKRQSLTSAKLQEDVDSKELGLFLKCFFHLLDCERIKRALKLWQGCNRKIIWVALVKALKELGKGDLVSECVQERNINGAFDLLRSGVLHDKRPVLAHIVRLYQSSPTKTLDFCAEDQKHVSCMDVLHMCQGHSKYPQHLIHYVNKRLEDLPPRQRTAAIRSMCKDRDFYLSWVQCLLVADGAKKEHLLCFCGMPRPGAHLFKWTQRALISEAQRHGLCCKEILQTFRDQGYWLGYVQLCDKTKEHTRQEVLEIVLQLGDDQLLHHEHKLECYPRTIRDWEYIFHLKELQSYGQSDQVAAKTKTDGSFCVQCGEILESLNSDNSASNAPAHLIGWTPSITWESLGHLLVGSVGSTKALDLLRTVKIPDHALSVAFLQNTLCTTVIQQQQRLIVHNILETVDTYLWSQKPTQMAPQVLFAIEEEKKCMAARSQGVDLHLNEALFSDANNRIDSKHWLEEPEGHWGVHTVITGVCPVCELPLKEQISIADPGIIVFDCGHSFHKHCLPEEACVLCLEENLLSEEYVK